MKAFFFLRPDSSLFRPARPILSAAERSRVASRHGPIGEMEEMRSHLCGNVTEDCSTKLEQYFRTGKAYSVDK